MAATTQVEVWVVVDAQGDTGQGVDADSAILNYTENIGELDASNGFRLCTITLTVPLPEVSAISLSASAPALASVKGAVS